MKRYIEKCGFVLLLVLITSSVVSCSLSEPKEAVRKTSCEKKEYQARVTNGNHKLEGKAQIYKGSLQGKETTNCDVLDMNSFTVAHATLPLPSHIKITNTENNKAVVVKVNDRRASQQNVVLQVTPAVASLLGAKSSFSVKIEIIPTEMHAVQTSIKKSKKTLLLTRPTNGLAKNRGKKSNIKYYIVVGTYTSQDEALAKFTRLSSIGIDNSTMETRNKNGRMLHMVRIGPFYQQDEIDKVKNKLQNDGLVKFTVVKN
jgi:rare lipoprotein A